MLNKIDHQNEAQLAGFEMIATRKEGGVLFAEIAAPPMNLLGPELTPSMYSCSRVPTPNLRPIT
jgi:hypothetical protein